MNGSRDARDRLRAANPLRVEDAPDPDSPQAHALFERIVATDPSAPEATKTRRLGRFRWRVLWVLVPAAILASAAGYGIFHRVVLPSSVVCYAQADLEADRALVPMGQGGPLATCGRVWEPGGTFHRTDGSEPALTACVLDTGVVAVFPGRKGVDTCGNLGVAPFDDSAEASEENQKADAVEEALIQAFLSRCVGQLEAVAIAKQQLTEHELADWQVFANDFSEERPCASPSVDRSIKIVYIVPVRNTH
jgi:hypothetical protein